MMPCVAGYLMGRKMGQKKFLYGAMMGSIYFLFAQQYAQAKEVAVTAVWGLIMGTVTASGIPEAIAAAILVAFIAKVLLKVRVIK